MNAAVAILSVGDELVLGQIEDTNAAWLARALQAIGRTPGERRTVGDDRRALADALRALASTHAAVILTGGLGPTLDDLTREALLDVVSPGAALVEDEAGVEHLRGWFERRGRPMPASNLRQAMRPPAARLLANPHGTAPGIAAEAGACRIYCLPGPPNEMKPMFDNLVAPGLRDDANVVATAALHSIGLGESALAELLGELMVRGREPSVGTTASDGIVSIRVRATGAPDVARRALEETVAQCLSRAGSVVYGRDGEPLASVVGRMLAERKLTISTAESCTGGMLGSFITDVAGSSAWYVGGAVTYANERKIVDLGVPAATIEAHGAVSHETAIAMARGALARFETDLAIATTGVAGPGGGSEAKPVGTVYVAVARRDGDVFSRRFHFPGDRTTVRRRTAHLALACTRFLLLGEGARSLLWSEGEAVRVERA
ncbi:MAG: competence/damage-inducible protein A [Planctomycetaceae bacterium]|nr:competence/damage-inducible protein A [Planctomycetaceae bacterium]